MKGNWKHGHSQAKGHSRTMNSWRSMMMRCYNENCSGFHYWGGRGITVCARWHDFANFLADMGERPAGLMLDRIDNDGNYEPSNCRWADQSAQSRNRRNTRFVEHNGETLSICEWAERLGVDPHVIQKRLARGWPVGLALTIAPGTVQGKGSWHRLVTMKEHPTGVARDALIGAAIGVAVAVMCGGWVG